MMAQRCTWSGWLFAGVLIASVAGNVDADVLVVGPDFPGSAEVIAATPAQGAFGQDTGVSLGQSFTVDNAFSAAAIFLEYENDPNLFTDHTLTMTIFQVADVQATNMVAGAILYTNTFTFPAPSSANTDTIATIVLDPPLALAAGGYAIQFTGTTDPGWEWLRSTATTGDDVYAGGKAYQDGEEKSAGTKDFALALSSVAPVLNPPTNLVFNQTGPALSSSTNGTDLGEFVTEAADPLPWVYSLVSGAGDTGNGSFQVSGDRLLTSGSFAGLGGTMLSFRARTEASGLSFEKALQVSVVTDSDNDNLGDDWELSWAPGDLDALNGDDVADADMDGLTDLAEYLLLFTQGYNMNPRSDDTDGDLILDPDELNGVAPRPPTNPTLADTDGDTLDDTVETNTGLFIDANDTGTDPTEADTDGDTLEDGVERATFVFVNAADPGTHPLTPDSDADGLTDGAELLAGTDPVDWDSDDDTAGDGLETILLSNPTNSLSKPSSFFWPVSKQTYSFPDELAVACQTRVAGTFGGVGIELLRGEQLTLAFDITGHEGGDAENLDIRLGFGDRDDFDLFGYMNPAIDVGAPTGTTAVIRYRNGSNNYGGTVNNQVVASSTQLPDNGGVVGTSTVSSVAFTLIRSDVGYTGVLRWQGVTLEATMTPVQFWGNPMWDKFHILPQTESGGPFDITNIRVIYENAQAPFIRPIVLSDVVAAGGATPSLQFSFPTDVGSSAYQLQGTSDLTNPAAWGPVVSGIPAGGATGIVSTVDVPAGDLGAGHRAYRVVVP